MAANVAQGTIYNYFESRDELFAHLLPEVGKMMIEFIAGHVRAQPGLQAKERGRIRGYLEFLRTHRSFYRVLQEAEIFAPEAHRAHIDNMVRGYKKALRQDVDHEGLVPPDEEDLEAIVYMLLGARSYLAMRLFQQDDISDEALEQMVEAYIRLVKGELFRVEGGRADVLHGTPRPDRVEGKARPA